MFQCEDGLIHFVFANEDHYCLPNLSHLPFESWLYYQLCREGYAYIFLGSGKDPFYVAAYESGANEALQDAARTGLITKVMKLTGIQNGQMQGTAKKFAAAEYSLVCRKLLQQSAKTAVVMPLECFYSLSEAVPDFVEKLIRDKLHFKYNGNILVLTSSLSVKDSHRILTDRNGPFARQYGKQSLCPNLHSMIFSGHRIPIYEYMQKTMHHQVSFLNQFSAAALRPVLESVMLHDPEIWLTRQELDIMASYLQLWFGSPELQKQRPLPFQDNPLHKFVLLEADLRKSWIFREVYREAMAYRERIPLKQNVPEVCMLSDNSASSLLEDIYLSANLKEEVLAQFLQIKKFFSTPWNHAWTEEAETSVQECFYLLKDIVCRCREEEIAQAVHLIYEYGRVDHEDHLCQVYNLLEGDLEIRKKYADISEKKQKATEQHTRLSERIASISAELKEENAPMGDPRYLLNVNLRKSLQMLQKVISSQNTFLAVIAGKRETLESILKTGDFAMEKLKMEDYRVISAQLEKNETALEDMVRQTDEVHKMMDLDMEQQLKQMDQTNMAIQFGKENADAVLSSLTNQFL